MLRQCMISHHDENLIHGGILMENGDIICLACGNLIPHREVGKAKEANILKVYESWVDLSADVIEE